jgi:hypothetical protein
MELSVENPDIKPIQLTASQWSFISSLLSINVAKFMDCGVIRPDQFPEARRQLMYLSNSQLAQHFARVSLTDPKAIVSMLSDFFAKCDALQLPIFWGNQHEALNQKLTIEAGTYVIGDLHHIVDVSVCDTLLASPVVLVCGDFWVYSYPVPSDRHVFFDNRDGVYTVTSAFAIAPKAIAKHSHTGREINVPQTSLWYDRGNVYFDRLSFNLTSYADMENSV